MSPSLVTMKGRQFLLKSTWVWRIEVLIRPKPVWVTVGQNYILKLLERFTYMVMYNWTCIWTKSNALWERICTVEKITWYNLFIKIETFPMLHFKFLFLSNTIKGSPKPLLKPLSIPSRVAHWQPWQGVPLWFVLPLSPNKATWLPLPICVSPYLQFFGTEPRDTQPRLWRSVTFPLPLTHRGPQLRRRFTLSWEDNYYQVIHRHWPFSG